MSKSENGDAAASSAGLLDDGIDLVFDIKLRRPACVLLQAIHGCGHNNGFMQMHFDDWLVAPTPDMRKIRGTREQWQQLAAKSSNAKTP